MLWAKGLCFHVDRIHNSYLARGEGRWIICLFWRYDAKAREPLRALRDR